MHNESEGLVMTSQEKAELLFKRKQERLADGQTAMAEYERHALGEREKMARLRTLRLARDAQLPSATAPAHRTIAKMKA
jgi:hypothetical protein